jgi:ketosteroid isomerase-like protein
MENRITWTLKKHGSGWLTIHEHSSTPASFKTLNVKLKRD